MKKKLIFLLLCIYSSSLLSQNVYLGSVIYSQTYNMLGNQESNNFVLLFNNDISFYEQILLEEKEGKEIIQTEKGTIISVGPSKTTKSFFYTNYKTNKLYSNYVVTDKYLLVEEDISSIKWELIDEYKKIGNFQCQKAKCLFRGRTYYVWFTNEIPIKNGPWKFSGLNGLIIEAYEDNYKIHIKATEISIKQKPVDNEKINKIDITKAIKINDLKAETEKIRNEFLSRFYAQLPKGAKIINKDEKCKDCGEDLEIFEITK